MDATLKNESIFDTSLSSLSTRSRNCCLATNINDVVDLVRFMDRHSLSEIQGCGKKTILELEQLANKYRIYRWQKLNQNPQQKVTVENNFGVNQIVPLGFKEQASEIYYSISESASPVVREAFIQEFPTPRFFYNAVLEDPEAIYVINKSVPYPIMESVWYLIREILSAASFFDEHNVEDHIFVEKVKTTLHDFNKEMLKRLDNMLYEYLPDSVKGVLENRYYELQSMLSQRSYNVLQREGINAYTILDFCYRISHEASNIPQCGRRTSEEILDRYKDFRKYIIGLATTENRDAQSLSAQITYPFLTTEQIDTIISHKEATGEYPLFAIIYYFFLNTKDRHVRLYDMYYGITGQKHNLKQIAERIGVTSERVRQILKAFKSPLELKQILSSVENLIIKNSHCPLHSNEIPFSAMLHINSFAEEMVNHELNRYNIKLSINGLAGILALINGYEISKYQDNYFLLHTAVVNDLSWPVPIEWLDKQVRSRSSSHRTISLKDALKGMVHCKSHGFARALNIMGAISHKVFGLKPDENHIIHIESNAIDFENELFSIIQDKGHPMHLNDLMNEFYKRNPSYSHKPRTSLKLHLFSSSRIRPIGKTGCYSLVHWEFNTLTIRELIAEILESSPKPLTAEEITEKLMQMGRPSNPNSVHASIGSDNKHSYVRFQGGLIGLEGKEYPPEYIPRSQVTKIRVDFTNRIEEFIQYLDKNQHLPSSSSSNKELSLYRWYNNIQNGSMELTAREKIELEKALSTRQHLLLSPREYIFRQRCAHYKEFIEKNGKRPSQSSCPSLYLWHRSARRSLNKLSEQESHFFNNLNSFLNSMGLES